MTQCSCSFAVCDRKRGLFFVFVFFNLTIDICCCIQSRIASSIRSLTIDQTVCFCICSAISSIRSNAMCPSQFRSACTPRRCASGSWRRRARTFVEWNFVSVKRHKYCLRGLIDTIFGHFGFCDTMAVSLTKNDAHPQQLKPTRTQTTKRCAWNILSKFWPTVAFHVVDV